MYDDKLYSVIVTVQGATVPVRRFGSLTHSQAVAKARKLRREIRRVGWKHEVSMYYRDGTLVSYQTEEEGEG